MPVGAASIGLGAVKAGLGLYETYQASQKLKQLEKQPLPSLGVSPELMMAYNRSLKMAQNGYTPEQTAAYKANVGQQQNTSYQQAVSQAGGNLSGAINAGLQSSNIAGANQFASNDADKRMQNIRYADSIAQQVQNQKNLEAQAALQRRSQLEQQYGLGKKTGLENITEGIGTGVTGATGSYLNNQTLDLYKSMIGIGNATDPNAQAYKNAYSQYVTSPQIAFDPSKINLGQ